MESASKHTHQIPNPAEGLSLEKSKSCQPTSPPMFSSIDSDEYTLPKATLTQMIKEMMPAEARMSCQSSDLIIQLTMNFLNYLSDYSNNICNQEGKKTITPSHVAKALKDMKMDSYLSKILELGIDEGTEVNLSEKQTKEMISQKLIAKQGLIGRRKNRSRKGAQDQCNGMTEEEMIAEQQRLFENDRLHINEDSESDEMLQQQQLQEQQYYYDQQQQEFYQQYYNATPEQQAQMMMEYQQYYMQQMNGADQQQMVYGENGQKVQDVNGQTEQVQEVQQIQMPSAKELEENKLYQDYNQQMQKIKSCKEVDEMNFDEE